MMPAAFGLLLRNYRISSRSIDCFVEVGDSSSLLIVTKEAPIVLETCLPSSHLSRQDHLQSRFFFNPLPSRHTYHHYCRHCFFTAMAGYTPSQVSTDESSLSESSPLTSSPLSTPAEPADFEDAPQLNVANGPGLGIHSSTSDPTFVLVIGGLGFIGSHTVLELLRAGFNGMWHLFGPHGSLHTMAFRG